MLLEGLPILIRRVERTTRDRLAGDELLERTHLMRVHLAASPTGCGNERHLAESRLHHRLIPRGHAELLQLQRKPFGTRGLADEPRCLRESLFGDDGPNRLDALQQPAGRKRLHGDGRERASREASDDEPVAAPHAVRMTLGGIRQVELGKQRRLSDCLPDLHRADSSD